MIEEATVNSNHSAEFRYGKDGVNIEHEGGLGWTLFQESGTGVKKFSSESWKEVKRWKKGPLYPKKILKVLMWNRETLHKAGGGGKIYEDGEYYLIFLRLYKHRWKECGEIIRGNGNLVLYYENDRKQERYVVLIVRGNWRRTL